MSHSRKFFVRSDLSIPTVEHSVVNSLVVISADMIPPPNTTVKFPMGISRRTFRFSPWYGLGIDPITYACQRQIERFLAGQDGEFSPNTIATYCLQGMRFFLDYVVLLSAATNEEMSLDSIGRALIDGFISSLDSSSDSLITKKNKYQATKSVLMALCQRGLIVEIKGGHDNATFPQNPFPGSDRTRKGEKPLTKNQRQAFALAVKDAVRPLFAEDVEVTSFVLSCALLIIALHTGRNTTPLLEMNLDCLRPHPKDGLSFLVLFKRRGHSISKVPIKDERIRKNQVQDLPTVKPTVAVLVRRVFELSAKLRPEAPSHFADRIWLYRMRSSGHGMSERGKVHALSEGTLALSIGILVKRYNLTDMDGAPLRINVSRLRKTFVNRIFEILEGDVASTAAAAGSTVQVTSINYLRPTEQSKKNWKFLGLALTNELLTNTIGTTEKTPIGACSDVINGDFAPKKAGLVCMSFINCIRCRNYVVATDDLYRLFSFYWRILSERGRMSKQQWEKQFKHIVRLIDSDIVENGVARGIFKQTVVDHERARARRAPHPFWQTDSIIEDITGLSE
jgi:hypothetical protein